MIIPTLEAGFGNKGALVNEPAADREVAYDFGIVSDAGRGGDGFDQGGEIIRAADLLDGAFAFEVMREGDQIDRFIVVIQFDHALKNELMRFPVKILNSQKIHDLVQGVIVDQDPGQNSLLRFNILGRDL